MVAVRVVRIMVWGAPYGLRDRKIEWTFMFRLKIVGLSNSQLQVSVAVLKLTQGHDVLNLGSIFLIRKKILSGKFCK